MSRSDLTPENIAIETKEGLGFRIVMNLPFRMPLHRKEGGCAYARRDRLNDAIGSRRLNREPRGQLIDTLVMHRVDDDARCRQRAGENAFFHEANLVTVPKHRIYIGIGWGMVA